MIREIDSWGVAVLMLTRYADDAEANADRAPTNLKPRVITLARRSGVGSQLRSSSYQT